MKNQILNEEFRRMQKLAGIITEEHSEMINEEGMTLPIPNFLKMGEPEFKVNFVKFTNNSKVGEKSYVRNDGSFPVSVETDAEGRGPGNKFVINAYVTKEGNLDYIFLPGYDNSDVLVKYVKDWGALRKYITSELAKTPTAAAPTAESIEQVVNEVLRAYRKKQRLTEALAKTYKVAKTAQEGNSYIMDKRWQVGDMLALEPNAEGTQYKLSTKDDVEQTYDGQSLESLIKDKFIVPVA